eukprot:SAG31_NODE_7351_length_1712_cov_1.360198_2_plen_98_part_00
MSIVTWHSKIDPYVDTPYVGRRHCTRYHLLLGFQFLTWNTLGRRRRTLVPLEPQAPIQQEVCASLGAPSITTMLQQHSCDVLLMRSVLCLLRLTIND